MNELTIKIVMLLFPGIIVTMIIDKFTEHKPWNSYKYSLFIIFYGILSYLVLQVAFLIKHGVHILQRNFSIENFDFLQVWQINQNLNLPYGEILMAGITAFFLGLLLTYMDNRECLAKLLIKLKITRKYGDYGVYQQILRANEDCCMDITIWDKKIIIRGIPDSIHESNGLCELCIYDAEIFNFNDESTNFLYRVNYISISEKYDNLMISTSPN